MGKTIGIVSLKGGVGKTSSVIALGDAIADFGKRALLVDANFSSPNLGLHLNIIDPEITIHHVLSRAVNLKDAIHKLERFDVVPASLFDKTKINPLKLKDRIKYAKKNYDVVLVDSSPALNEETLGVMLASDQILVVTTPDHSSLGTTLKAVKLAKQRGVPISGLILNKVYNKNFELSLSDIENTAEVPVMAVIPHDVNVLRALSEFTSSVSYNPKSEASIEYKKLAATLLGEKYYPKRFKDLFRINPKRQEVNREVFYERVFND